MKKVGCLIGGIVGAIVLGILGIGGVAWWGWNAFSDQAKEALNENAVIREHVGEIESMSIKFEETGEAVDEDVFVFDVKGSKASGVVSAAFVSMGDDREGIRSGTLTLESGEVYELLPSEAAVSETGSGDGGVEFDSPSSGGMESSGGR